MPRLREGRSSVTQIDALLALRSDGRLLIRRDRIALLEAVIEPCLSGVLPIR
jgi:hypothetical protein